AGTNAISGRTQNAPVVTLTSSATEPATQAISHQRRSPRSRQLMAASTQARAAAVARYSISSARDQTSANGEERKKGSARNAAAGDATRRTRAQSSSAVAQKQARAVSLSERSGATPASITRLAAAWNSGNSSGISKGGPRIGSFAWKRSMPFWWKS